MLLFLTRFLPDSAWSVQNPMRASNPDRTPRPDTPRGAVGGVSLDVDGVSPGEEELAVGAALLERVERALDLTRDFLTPEELEEHRRVLLSLARCHPRFLPRRADGGAPPPGESGVVLRRDGAALEAAFGARPLPGESGVVPTRDDAALTAAAGQPPPPDASGFVRIVDDASLAAAAARRGGRRGGAT
jgi:hypothetical protein